MLLRPGLLFRVSLEVGVEHCFRSERFVTVGTGVGPVAGVASQVDHQSGSLGEPFVTVSALVGSLARVCSPMNAQIILRDERLVAEVADVRLLASVFSHVHREVGLARDRLAADMTDVLVLGPNVAVRSHVHEQHLFPGESFVAQLAVVFLLRRHIVRLVQLGVQPETLSVPKGRVADFTDKRFLFRVDQLVVLIVVSGVESGAAHLALVLVVEIVTPLVAYEIVPVRTAVSAGRAGVQLLALLLALLVRL